MIAYFLTVCPANKISSELPDTASTLNQGDKTFEFV